MKRIMAIGAVAAMVLAAFVAIPQRANANGAPPETVYYPDRMLSGGFQSGHFDDIWDLTAGDMTLSFTYDANGLVDISGAHAWAELGIRALGYGDFNPTWMAEGAGVWLATDYDWTPGTFGPDPTPPGPILDLDDKLILQKGGGMGEGSYNLPSVPPNPWANHRVWWDRDGVDSWQNDETANTGGIYQIVIELHATSSTAGTAYMNIRGLDQGFETDGNWATIELTPAGMTFTGDMEHMQVFYGLYGYGATHSVEFKDITVTGRLWRIPATVDIRPDDLNTDRKSTIVTIYIELPAPYSVEDIDVGTVTFEGRPPLPKWQKIGDYDWDGIPDLMLKFDIALLVEEWRGEHTVGDVELTVTGLLTSGQPFEGSDTIFVFYKGAI